MQQPYALHSLFTPCTSLSPLSTCPVQSSLCIEWIVRRFEAAFAGMIWSEGFAPQDPLAGDYFSGGYHANNASEGEGRVYFTWYGSDIWVYGGYRDRLGPYQIILDGIHTVDFPGFQSGDQQDLDAVLFNSTRLKETEHQLEIINVSSDPTRPTLDISRIVYQYSVYSNDTISASDRRCQWSSLPSGPPMWFREAHSTSLSTYSSLANMNITFNGKHFSSTGIALYGNVGPDNSPFFVTVDGSMPQVMTPNAQVNSSTDDPDLLYILDGLDSGSHTLVVRNSPNHAAEVQVPSTLNIHHAVVLDSEKPAPSTAQINQHANLVVSVILGAVALLCLLLIAYLVWRYRRRRFQHLEKEMRVRPFLIQAATSPPLHPISISRHSSVVVTTDVHAEWSLVATKDTSSAHEDEGEFSPSSTLFSRANTQRQRARRKSRPMSLTTMPLVGESSVPLFPTSPPPVASPPLKPPNWPDHQLPPPYRSVI